MARRSITIDGFNHGQQPIPAASRVGDIIMTGGVYGLDPATGEIAESVEDQARLMFMQLGRILEAAGSNFDHVVKLTVYIKVQEARAAVNVEWLKRFPDPASRPARHTLTYDHLPGKMLVQCDATAIAADA